VKDGHKGGRVCERERMHARQKDKGGNLSKKIKDSRTKDIYILIVTHKPFKRSSYELQKIPCRLCFYSSPLEKEMFFFRS
jgi:hypothetical protein